VAPFFNLGGSPDDGDGMGFEDRIQKIRIIHIKDQRTGQVSVFLNSKHQNTNPK
jgi:hypothetical protein